MSLEELFRQETGEDCEAALHGDFLERLVRGATVRMGSELLCLEEPPENCYIGRVLKRGDREVTEADILCEKEKVVLIVGGAGSGKSALLAKLAADVKSKSSSSWVALVKLADFTATLKECQTKGRDAISLEGLLSVEEATKPATPFEEFVFRRKESVVLMLDGIDEVFPEYERLVLGLLTECREAPYISKVVLTARLHIVELLEEQLAVTCFALQPFTRDNLREFLVAYWMQHLRLQEASKKKCETYVTELIRQVSPSIMDDHFVRTPLGAKVLAELFQQSDPKNESTEWEGCREYLNGDRMKPRLSQRLIARLFEAFIEEIRIIFMDRANPNGNTIFNCLYEECLACHRTLALNEVVDKNEKVHGLFSGNPQIDENLEVAMLRMGFVQKVNSKLRFAYRGIKDYFFAEVLLKELQSANLNTELQEYFLEVVFSDYNFEDIRYFLNKYLKGIVDSLPSDLMQINRSYLNLVHKLAEEGCEAILELLFKYMNCQIDVNTKDKHCRTALYRAAIGGHLDTVKFLVEQGADVNITNDYSSTALHSAAQGGHLDTVKFLIERGADMNIEDKSYQTPVHYATWRGHFDTVKCLVERGADVNTVEQSSGQTALHSAVEGGYFDMVKFLVEQGAADVNIADEYGSTALHCAVEGHHLNIIKFLIKRGADMNFQNISDHTPLHSAAWQGHFDTVKCLVEQGADVNMTNSFGQTTLHSAAEGGHVDTVKFLVEQGADVNITDDNSSTALHCAVIEGHLDTVKFLVERGAKVGIKNSSGWTVLHCAAFYGRLDAVKFFVEQEIDVNITENDHYGQTALHYAANQGYLSIVKILVERGADVDIKDIDGRTPLGLATINGEMDTVKFLVERGAKVGIKDSKGWTVLHCAAFYGRLDAVKFFVEQGVDVNMTANDHHGETALHYAVKAGYLNIVKFLVERGADVDIKDSDGKTPLGLAMISGDMDTIKFLLSQSS